LGRVLIYYISPESPAKSQIRPHEALDAFGMLSLLVVLEWWDINAIVKYFQWICMNSSVFSASIPASSGLVAADKSLGNLGNLVVGLDFLTFM